VPRLSALLLLGAAIAPPDVRLPVLSDPEGQVPNSDSWPQLEN
jgi:hypothetical protein